MIKAARPIISKYFIHSGIAVLVSVALEVVVIKAQLPASLCLLIALMNMAYILRQVYVAHKALQNI